MANCGAQCEACGKWFTWEGRWIHMPECPRCRHRPEQTELERMDAHASRVRGMIDAHRTVPS